MPLFESASAAMTTVRDYMTNMLSGPTVLMRQTASSVKHKAAIRSITKKVAQEASKIDTLALKCRLLTPESKQEYITRGDFSKALDKVIKKTQVSMLSAHGAFIQPVIGKVHEYLAISQLFDPQDVVYNRPTMTMLLRDALQEIISASRTTGAHKMPHGNSITLKNAFNLIEHTALHRCQAIRQTVDIELQPYVHINEMLQLLYVLQEKLNTISEDRLKQCVRSNIYAQQVSAGTLRQADLLENAAALSAIRDIDISDIVEKYFANLPLLQQKHNVDTKRARVSINRMKEDARVTMDYDVLIATQVFAAIAARRGLYHEMQRCFNDEQQAHIQTVIACADNYVYQSSLADPALVPMQIIQLRITHAVRTYYLYHLLEEFVYSALAPAMTRQLVAMHCQFRKCAHILVASLHPDIIDPIAIDVSLMLTDYIYASVLIHAINKHGEPITAAQAHELLQNMDDDSKQEIALAAAQHAFAEAAHRIVARLRIDKETDACMLHRIMSKIDPAQIKNTRFINFIKGQAIQILNRLPDTRLDTLRQHTMPALLQACRDQLSASPEERKTDFCLEGTPNNFRLLYMPNAIIEKRNIIHTINLITLHSEKRGAGAQSIIAARILDMLSIATHKHKRPLEAMSAASFAIPKYRTQVPYMLCNTLTHQLYLHGTAHTSIYYKMAVVAGSTAALMAAPQYLLYPLQFLQQTAYNITSTVVDTI